MTTGFDKQHASNELRRVMEYYDANRWYRFEDGSIALFHNEQRLIDLNPRDYQNCLETIDRPEE